MMKHKYSFFFFLFLLFQFVSAQPPENYYEEAYGLTGYELKTKLSEITGEGYNQRTYGSLWSFFIQNDMDTYYENDNTILDVYSENPEAEDSYTFQPGTDQCGSAGYSAEGDCYNREHLMPQSWFGKANPMRTDVHHIFPVDGYVNAIHGHMPFGEVDNPNYVTLNGSKRGPNAYDHPTAYTGEVFEPIDEFKGDIARTYLYMAMRYENQVAGWVSSNSGSQNTFNGTSDQVFNDWTLSMLLKWHNEDPVSQREIERNDAAYVYQGNRNPFIDHPEFANMIWNPEETVIFDEVFEEDFNDCPLGAGTFMAVSEMSDADWECLGDSGQFDSGAMQMYAMADGQNQPSIDWLITAEPLSFDNYSEEKLSFYAASTFGNTPLQVLYSTNFDGSGNPSDFDWHTFPGVSIPKHTGIEDQEMRHYFADIDISLPAQQSFYLAFRYDNSNGQQATRWIVDDVKITGISEMNIPKKEVMQAYVYPNPVKNNKVYVQIPQTEKFEYIIYNLQGQKVKEDKVNQNHTQIFVGDLQSGVYLIHFENEGKKITKHLIVQ